MHFTVEEIFRSLIKVQNFTHRSRLKTKLMSVSDFEDAAEPTNVGEKGPFGNPDGGRNPISKSYLVDMTEVAPHLAIGRTDLSTHMIVGRKGAGKTLHHRSLSDLAAKKEDIISIKDVGSLKDSTLRHIAQRFDPEIAQSIWATIWRRSIYSFLGSLLYAKHKQFTFHAASTLRPVVDEHTIRARFGAIFTIPSILLTPVQYVETLVSKYSRAQDFESFIFNTLWNEFENIVDISLASAAPIYVFIDSLDGQPELFPRLWHDCQLGLFLTVFEMLSKSHAGGRIHVVTTIRESVYRSILRTQHATNFFSDSHLRRLNWGLKEARHFLERKIQKLPSQEFGNRKLHVKERTLEAWLGFDEVSNLKRRINEPVLQYIMRHTRCLPRDVVIVGNLIAEQKERCESLGTPFTDGYLRRCVEISSHLFAQETLDVCITELLLTRPSLEEYKRVLGLHDDDIIVMKPAIYHAIERFIQLLGTEVVSKQTMVDALKQIYGDGDRFFVHDTVPYYRLDHVLWRNGMIAYQADRGQGKKRWIFNWYSDATDDLLSQNAERYGLHPALIDKFGLINAGSDIVF
jgi:hypothetical protein